MNNAQRISSEVSESLRPAIRIDVSEAGKKYVKVRTPSGGVSAYDPDMTPYMIEPANLLESRLYDAIIFVGPAQSGKTQGLIDIWIGYVVKCNPSDMTIFQTSQVVARDYSMRRVDRLLRNSPEISEQLANGSKSDNTFDKIFKGGNILNISWPSISQLSGRAIKRVAFTDYDRIPEDIDGEGNAFNLGRKRTQTFLSRAMTLAESSPGHEIVEPKYKLETEHEAPPTRGILSLYNLGDRRRWYWECPECKEYFMQPMGIDGFYFDYKIDERGITDTQLRGDVGIICTKCGAIINEKHKPTLNASGKWLAEGLQISNGEIIGQARKTRIASFWLPGAAAAFQSWKSIIQNYLQAQREFDTTGSEESLKTVTNVDLGAPYLPRRYLSEIDSNILEKRAEDMGKKIVPLGVRFLIVTIDVQRSKFVVQVDGIGVDYESWTIDRFDIVLSNRVANGDIQPVDPAGYVEDWNLLIDRVIKLQYPLADESGRKMAVLITGCDSGGREGVTERAYTFWRKLRSISLSGRFYLLKGQRPKINSKMPRVQKSYPDNTDRNNRKANARGEIPLWLLNTTLLKDEISADLKRIEPGPRYQHFPDWLPNSFYEELTAEVRTDSGWDNPGRARNEAFDLKAYCRGTLYAYLDECSLIDIDWNAPPPWARNWDNNTMIDYTVTERPRVKRKRQLGPKGNFVTGWK